MHVKIRETAKTILWILAVIFVVGSMLFALRNETAPAYQITVIDGHQYLQTKNGHLEHLIYCNNPACVERLLEGKKLPVTIPAKPAERLE